MDKTTVHFRGVPTFLRALCEEAAYGGTSSYRTAGYELARHTAELLESDTDEEWQAKLNELYQALTGCAETPCVWPMDEARVIAWYTREFPRCMDLVPARRHAIFAEGIRQCWEDENMNLGGPPLYTKEQIQRTVEYQAAKQRNAHNG